MGDNMEVEPPSARDKLIGRLREFGVPPEQLNPSGLVAFVKDSRASIHDLVTLILREDESYREDIEESMAWLKCLMTEGDPDGFKMDFGSGGVCGALFGKTDVAYRCKTCEYDPTCAICDSCFEIEVHKDHDYYVLYTGGGCCDCGDKTAWKPEGFCPLHKGAEKIRPCLEQRLDRTFAPVLVSLLGCWKDKLNDRVEFLFTSHVVDMLLEFTKSGALVNYVAKLLLSSPDLLNVLVRAELSSEYDTVTRIHELLLKLLGDPAFKDEFAIVFLKYYPLVIVKGIQQMSDYSLKRFPLLSLFSVQIFTVPTLTLRLVKDCNLLTTLFDCLHNIFIQCNKEGVFQVSWTRLYETTMRVVEDIQFVISHEGVSKYVTNDQQDVLRTWMTLLTYVQGMNPLWRRREHITGSNTLPFVLCRAVDKIHSLLVDGALPNASKGEMDDASHLLPDSSLRLIYECLRGIENSLGVETTSGVLTKKLSPNSGAANSPEELQFLSLPDWPPINYDVSSQSISVHIPVHRFLSMLLQKALRRHCESEVSDLTDICFTDSPSTTYNDFFGHALQGSCPHGFSAFTMEHPLRIMVFCAEVRAGKWRKHGYAAKELCEWYRSTHWSQQSVELDIFLLQVCAAIGDKDLFVTRILERFGLSDYLDYTKLEPIKYEPVLVQEMLTLIIQIAKERRFCGPTTVESLKRELICKLSIGDATHSELVASLPCDLLEFEELQSTLDTVASYSNPSEVNQRMYSLRPEFWEELDLYHPRWDSKELEGVVERYLLFSEASARTTLVPKWTKIYSPMREVASIATCKVVLEIIRAVLFYSIFFYIYDDVPRAPDSVLLPALHLLSLSLDICLQQKEHNRNNVAKIPIIKLSGEKVGGSFFDIEEQSLLSLLVSWKKIRKEENTKNKVEADSDSLFTLIESILQRFSEIDDSCMTQLKNLEASHIPERVPNLAIQIERARQKKAQQAAVMATITAAQKKFLDLNINVDDGSQHDDEGGSDTVHEGDLDTNDSNVADGSQHGDECEHDYEEFEKPICCICKNQSSGLPISYFILLQKSRLVSSVDRGPPFCNQLGRSNKEHMPLLNTNEIDTMAIDRNSGSLEPTSSSQLTQVVQTAAGDLEWDMYNSILSSSSVMSEDSISGGNSTAMLNTESALHLKYTAYLVREISEVSSASSSENASVESTSHHLGNDGFGPTDCDGVHLTACGHAAHQKCLDDHLSTGTGLGRSIEGHIVDADQGEFPCPMCRLLVNCVLPTLPGELHMPFTAPISQLNDMTSSLRLQQAIKLLQSAANAVGNAVGNDKFHKAPLHHIDSTGLNFEKFSLALSKMYFPRNQNKLSRFARLNHSMLMWDTLKYSLMSLEIVARRGKTSLTPNLALSAMYEELKSKFSSGYTLPLLLKLVQKARSNNSVHVLQRFRGVQLFAESICSGVSLSYVNNDMSVRGDMFSILKHIEMDTPNGDICFWNQASNPVLANDPFSTLMWVLFCLPHPFLSCVESLTSLVHVFYVVAVTQAIILYYEKSRDKSSREPSLLDCLITDVYKIIGESGCVSQYFVSNYFEFDPSVDIKEMIRRFSFPYLRRCALLWKILYSSIPPPFCGEETMSSNTPKDTVDEVTEIEELENMFKIPPLDVVLKDEFSRSSVSTWCRHFCKEFQSQRIQRNIHVTPAVPFELMKLPNFYHELLQRYIKKRCPDCRSGLANWGEPALCLLCGRLCSHSQKSCCSKSGCQTHAATCGAGTGVFLLIRKTNILLYRSARQALWPSPYLDGFAEEDIGIFRGMPLSLKEERYADLTHMVASHGMELSSKFRGNFNTGF